MASQQLAVVGGRPQLEVELVVVEEEEGDFHAARDDSERAVGDSARSLGGRSTESAASQSTMSRDTSEDTLIREADDLSVQVEAEVA